MTEDLLNKLEDINIRINYPKFNRYSNVDRIGFEEGSPEFYNLFYKVDCDILNDISFFISGHLYAYKQFSLFDGTDKAFRWTVKYNDNKAKTTVWYNFNDEGYEELICYDIDIAREIFRYARVRGYCFEFGDDFIQID